MSKVYSFRLDENNPREAQAREVIDAWARDGFSLRQILVDALLSLSEKKNGTDGLNEILKKLDGMLQGIESKNKYKGYDGKRVSNLPETFISAIKVSVRPGTKTD